MGKLRYMARGVALGGALLLGAAACAPVYRDHGYVPTEHDLAEVAIGDSREAVAGAIGYPTATGVLTDSAWYYVQSRWRHYGAMAPGPVDRQVLAVSFTPQGRVANIERYTLEDGRVVTLSRRVTETSIADVSFITQLLSNVGRVDAGQFLGDGMSD